MNLDDFTTTDDGLTVRGASPDYLDELLAQYSVLQRHLGYDPDEFLQPGISRAQVVDAWAERGLDAPEEAIRLWQWHNGYPFGRYPGTDLESLQQSLGHYDWQQKGHEWGLWDPDYIPIALGGGYAMSTKTAPPLIRTHDMLLFPDDEPPDGGTVSFCTIVAIGIWAREQGLYQPNADGNPSAVGASWPTELRGCGMKLF